MTPAVHIPVMRDEMLQALRPGDGEVYLDGTFGAGGYARAILDAADCTLFALDRDPDAIARGAALAARAAEGIRQPPPGGCQTSAGTDPV